MEPDSPASKDGESTARKQRMDAIRSLAGASTQVSATHEREQQGIERSLGVPRGGRRRALIWGGSVSLAGIMIAVMLVSVLRGASSTARPTARSLEVIQFLQGHLTCPQSASWSPNGKELAVVGYAVCDSPDAGAQGTHPLVALYNATNGRETAVLPLESALVRDATHGAALDAYQLDLGSAVWTADSQTIGVTFTLASTAKPDVIYGLVVLRVTGSAAAIIPTTPLIHAEITFQAYSRYTTVPPLVARFNTANGSATAIAPPPSLLYKWSAQGTLAPAALPDAHAQTLPASMSGNISYVCSSSENASAPGNRAYYWISAGGSAWSPDGLYFYSTLGAYGRLTNSPPPATSQPAAGSQRACDVAGPPSKWPIVTMPVGGLDSAENGLDPYNITELWFVTSPGGSRVAVSEQTASGEQTVSVYDTATGKLLTQFVAPQLLKQAHVTTDQGGDLFPTMSWSPDAGSLALLDTGDRALIILGPSQLH